MSAANNTGIRLGWLRDWVGVLIFPALLGSAGALCLAAGVAAAKTHFGEDGLVERATPVFYAATAVLYLVWRNRIGARSWVPSVILLLMSARELDADRWFTNKSVTSTGYYFDNPGVSYGERIAVGVVALAVIAMILHLLWTNRAAIVRAIREFQPYVRTMLCAFFMLGVSQLLDGLSRSVRWLLHTHLPTVDSQLAGISEETIELGVSIALFVALLQLCFDSSRNRLPHAAFKPRPKLSEGGEVLTAN